MITWRPRFLPTLLGFEAFIYRFLWLFQKKEVGRSPESPQFVYTIVIRCSIPALPHKQPAWRALQGTRTGLGGPHLPPFPQMEPVYNSDLKTVLISDSLEHLPPTRGYLSISMCFNFKNDFLFIKYPGSFSFARICEKWKICRHGLCVRDSFCPVFQSIWSSRHLRPFIPSHPHFT